MLTQEDFEKNKNKSAFKAMIESKLSEEDYNSLMYSINYENELIKLQAELVDLQQWVAKHNKRVCIIF